MSDEIKDQIGEMIKSLADQPGNEPEPEPIKEPEPTPEPEPEVKEEVKEPESEPEPEPEVKEPKPDVKEDNRDKTIADLRAKIADFEAKKSEPVKQEPKKEQPVSQDEDQDFLGELDVDEVTRDPKELNRLLNKIHHKAVMDTRDILMRDLPNIVRTQATIVDDLRRTSEQFYNDNKDLAPFKKVVATVFEEFVSKSPDKSYSDLIKEVGPEVRKRLELPTPSPTKSAPESSKPPRLPSKGSRAGQVQDSSTNEPLQSEIEAMNKVLGGNN